MTPTDRATAARPDALHLVLAVHNQDAATVHHILQRADLVAVAVVLADMVDESRTVVSAR